MTNRKFAPTAIDLFSGCGGLTLGLTQAGFNVISAVEVDPLAVKTYKANHPNVLMWDVDIRNLSTRQVKRRLKLGTGQLDLLAACPPCQGFSQMRTLRGSKSIEDPDNALLFKVLQFVRELKPKAIMLENVPALATDIRMKRFLEALRLWGYWVDEESIRIVNAASFGVPQRRKRMMLLVGRRGKIKFAEPSLEDNTVRKAIEGLPLAGSSGDPLHDLVAVHSPQVMKRIQGIPKDGGSRSALGKEHQLDCHKKCNGFTDIYGRMAWDDVAPTITSGCTNPSKGRFLHPFYDRAITLREAALLQSFPADYYFSLERGKSSAALLIGNALPPEFIKRHALEVHTYLHTSCSLVYQTEREGIVNG